MTEPAENTKGYDKIARFYDLDVSSYDEDFEFYRNLAIRGGGPVLELGCGTGRLLTQLALSGFDVDGLDISEQMLNVAHRRISEFGVESRVRLIKGDVCDFEADRKYQLVVFPVNSFMHLATPSRQMSCLESVRRVLAPGGTFALDLPNPEPSILGQTEHGLVVEYTKPGLLPGWTVTKLRSQEVDPVRQLLTTTFVYDEVAPSGSVRRTSETFQMRYLHRNELESMMSRAGFTTERVTGDFDGSELNTDSSKLIVVANRS